MSRAALAAIVVTSVTACSNEAAPPRDRGVAITIAPLSLPGVADACYELTVYNTGEAGIGPGAIVWREGSVCADRYGDERGSVTYVGTCDADPEGRTNTVSLVLEGLCQVNGCDPSDDDDPGTIDSATYVNPCPADDPCLVERPCRANADTQVAFDLTIMRRANQGFFDVAVTFADVFCSAKLDCVPELLHRPEGGPRDLTAVLAFACTSGADETCLYATSVELDCGAPNVWQIDPSAGPGNIPEASPLLYGAATYQGDEAFTSFDKSYWNIALGLDEASFAAYPSCTLRWTTTASEAPLGESAPYQTPDGTSYPLLVWERDIIVGGQLACESHGLDQILPGELVASVATAYSEPDAAASFAFTNCAPGDDEACTCPAGYTASADGAICRRVVSFGATPADETLAVCAGGDDHSYSMYGARFTTSWTPGDFEIVESGDPAASCTDASVCVSDGNVDWQGHLADVGVWACDPTGSPLGVWIGFSQCVTLPASGVYLVGIAGDNGVRLSVDGDLVYESVSSLNFQSWNVGRVTLTAGTHVIEMAGMNTGSVAGFGAEIYGPFDPASVATPAQMAAALSPPIDPSLIVFSTRDMRPVGGVPVAVFQTSSDGQSGYTCDAGFALDLCGDDPMCTDTDEVACGTTVGGDTTPCDAPGPNELTDGFTRPDGPLGPSYVDLGVPALPIPQGAITSGQVCATETVQGVVLAETPTTGMLHLELDVTFQDVAGRRAMAIGLDTCPSGGPAVVTAGIAGGSAEPRLTIATPLTGLSIQSPNSLNLQLDVTYRLYADFFADGHVVAVLRQGNTDVDILTGHVITDGLLTTVPTYRRVGFVIGDDAPAPTCADNLWVITF
ncbi:MAG: hypothetical protein IT385_27215 [Deltaproteobacteria bacterium]|nr:hypothetical protein [Deltaproteobacteria bacterium]